MMTPEDKARESLEERANKLTRRNDPEGLLPEGLHYTNSRLILIGMEDERTALRGEVEEMREVAQANIFTPADDYGRGFRDALLRVLELLEAK